MKYENNTNFEIALHPRYEKPLDDRLQIAKESDLYITSISPASCKLYARTYVGMEITLTNNGQNTPAFIYVLKDNTPYLLNQAQTVNASNFSNFWYRIGYAQDTSINIIESSLAEVIKNVQEVSEDTISNINTSISNLETQIKNNINASINAVNSHINSSYIELQTYVTTQDTAINNYINASVNDLKTYVDTQDYSINSHINTSYVELNNIINQTKSNLDVSYVALSQHVDTSYRYLDSSWQQMYNYLYDNEKVWARWIITSDNSIGIFQRRLDGSLNYMDSSVQQLWNSLVTKGIINPDGTPKSNS